jgi:hypothetical protein
MARPTPSSPARIRPQLAALVKAAPDGSGWLHEIKLDGYRMHVRIDADRVQILTRRGNDWTAKYPTIEGARRATHEERLLGWRTLRRPAGWKDGLQPDPERARTRRCLTSILPSIYSTWMAKNSLVCR